MGRETHLMPVVWEPITMRWQQVSDDKWEPVKYQFPVVAPETGKVERYTSLPLMDIVQEYNDAFYDTFEAKESILRLYLKPETFNLRERYSLMGIRQKESDIVLCKGYIGTNIGIYATSNGSPTKEYADFDWVSYKVYPRL